MTKKITVDTSKFKEMMSLLAPIANSGTGKHSKLIYFNEEDAIVFNGKICIFYAFPFPRMLVRFHELNALVQRMTGPSVTVKCTPENVKIIDKTTSATIGHVIDSIAVYNKLTTRLLNRKIKWKALPETFWDMCKKASLSCSKNDRLGVLTGVNISRTFIESSDNRRYTKIEIPKIELDTIIPAKNITLLRPVKFTLYHKDQDSLYLQNESETICAMLTQITEEFPDFSEVFEDKNIIAPFTVEFTGELINDFSLVADFAEKMEPVKVTISKDGFDCQYSSQYSELLKQIRTNLHIKKPVTFCINPLYLIEAMSVFKEGEVTINQNTMVIDAPGMKHIMSIDFDTDILDY